MKNKIILFIALFALFCAGCHDYTEEEIAERNAKSRAQVEQEAEKPKVNKEIKSGGSVIAKKIGGSSTIELPTNTKLQLVTWKGDELWFLYRPMRKDEVPETYIYEEDSKFGIMEAKYTIVESRG